MADVTEKLERLAGLLERGLITREEFDQQKQVLLDGGPTTSTDSLPAMPNQVGAYLITGHVGDGGMGSVYRGKHRSAQIASRQGGEVAIKVMHPHIARNKSFAERFEQEAGLGLKLDHPGICKVQDLVMDGGVLALVMELVEGEPLSEVIGSQTGPIPWERVMRVVVDPRRRQSANRKGPSGSPSHLTTLGLPSDLARAGRRRPDNPKSPCLSR